MKILGLEISIHRILPFERRKAERVNTHQYLSLNFTSPVYMVNGSAQGIDLSTLGVRFACYTELPKGSPLCLTLQFPSEYGQNKILRAYAYVVRCYRKSNQRRYRIACVFNMGDAIFPIEIQNFIRWLKERTVNAPQR